MKNKMTQKMNHSLTQRISISINTFEHLLVSTLTITLLSLHPASICSQMVQKRNLFFIKPIFHPTVRTLIESDVTITKSIEDANDSLVWMVGNLNFPISCF